MIPGLVSGAIAGYIASLIVNGEGKGCLVNLFVGWIGGLFGDWLFSLLRMKWHLFHPWFGAILGAIIVLLIYNWIAGKKIGGTKAKQEPEIHYYKKGDEVPDDQFPDEQ